MRLRFWQKTKPVEHRFDVAACNLALHTAGHQRKPLFGKWEECSTCNGYGWDATWSGPYLCSDCKGKGWVPVKTMVNGGG